jgi:hypothetical protein
MPRTQEGSAPGHFGRAQAWAALLLLLFCVQVLWLILRTPLSESELAYTQVSSAGAGLLTPAGNSPATALMARAGALASPAPWACRFPFLLVGALLGASIWYVARRLYGNAGGFIALTLYAFSPSLILRSARVQPEIAAAWSIFGSVFTAIAVAHTLYAPRRALWWNWRRIALLGLAMGVGAAAQFWSVIAVIFGLGFMLYLAPGRRRAVLAIVAVAVGAGTASFLAICGFHPAALLAAALDSGDVTLRLLASASVWRAVGALLLRNSPGFVLLLGLGVLTLAAWPRARGFGNLAPFTVAAGLILLGLLFPHAGGFTFLVSALPFLFVFAGGIWADLLETRQAALTLGVVLAALVVHAYFSLSGLFRHT